MIEYAKYEAIQVVERNDVAALTLCGWKLLEVVPSSNVYIATVQKQRLRPETSYHETYFDNEPHVINQPLFVLGLAYDEVVKGLNERVDELEKLNSELHESTASAQKALKQVQTEYEAQRLTFKKTQELLDQEYSASKQLGVTLRKMEADLAKVRTAVGTERMKEILG